MIRCGAEASGRRVRRMSDTVSISRGVPTHVPWQFYIGDDWPIAIECHDSNGDQIDLTGATAIIWKLGDATRTTNVIALSLADGVSVDPNDNHIANIIVPRTDTANLTAGYYFDELIIHTADDLVEHQVTGRIEAVAGAAGSRLISRQKSALNAGAIAQPWPLVRNLSFAATDAAMEVSRWVIKAVFLLQVLDIVGGPGSLSTIRSRQ